MRMNARLMEAFSRGKVEISCYFADIQETMDVTSFPLFIFDLLKESFSCALEWQF